jgi:hypothetical protein
MMMVRLLWCWLRLQVLNAYKFQEVEYVENPFEDSAHR